MTRYNCDVSTHVKRWKLEKAISEFKIIATKSGLIIFHWLPFRYEVPCWRKRKNRRLTIVGGRSENNINLKDLSINLFRRSLNKLKLCQDSTKNIFITTFHLTTITAWQLMRVFLKKALNPLFEKMKILSRF